MNPSISAASLSNVVRLHAVAPPSRVLCVGREPVVLAHGFAAWGADVHPESGAPGSAHSTAGGGPFEVIVAVTGKDPIRLGTLLSRAAPGALLLLGVTGRRARPAEAACREAGVDVLLRYRVSPSLDRPLYVVPDRAGALASYLDVRSPVGPLRAGLRRLTLALGWRPLDHPDVLLVARAP